MGKALVIFLTLCAVVGGTVVWLKTSQPKTPFLESAASFITELLADARDSFFLKQLPPPNPEAVARFKKAVDRELEQLNATRQFAEEKTDESHRAPGAHVPHTPTQEPHTRDPGTRPRVF